MLSCHTIPGRSRRVSGADLDDQGKLRAQFLYFDGFGHLLVRWGLRTVHFWNFSHSLPYLAADRARLTEKFSSRPTKADIACNLQEDLAAYEDERSEKIEYQRILSEYSLAGLSEAEMLQYAQLISLEQSLESAPPHSICAASSTPPTPLAPVHNNASNDDYDLQLAIQLSLSEIEK